MQIPLEARLDSPFFSLSLISFLTNQTFRTLTKTEDYLDIFARFKRKENIDAVERILDESGLARFEKSQLGKPLLSGIFYTLLISHRKSML
jgi:hypothetical protein